MWRRPAPPPPPSLHLPFEKNTPRQDFPSDDGDDAGANAAADWEDDGDDGEDGAGAGGAGAGGAGGGGNGAGALKRLRGRVRVANSWAGIYGATDADCLDFDTS